MRGPLVITSAIDVGLILSDTEGLSGVEGVFSRLRAGESSSLSELTVGATLSRLGFSPAFGIASGSKVPDLAVVVGSTITFIEVIAPDRAQIVENHIRKIGEIASSIVAVASGANVELFLDADPEEVDMIIITAKIGEAPFSEDVQEIPSNGRFLKRPFSFSPVVSPSIASGTSGTVLGDARVVIDGSTGALAVVRAAVFDSRAKRLLGAELHHFLKTNPNLLVIDTGNVPGGIKDWGPSLMRAFQPTQNTRVTAILLYQTGIIGAPPRSYRAWQILSNPHAANSLPGPLLEALDKLPKSWPAA